MAALKSKEQLVRITFEHLELSLDTGCLQYLDSLSGTAAVVGLTDPLA